MYLPQVGFQVGTGTILPLAQPANKHFVLVVSMWLLMYQFTPFNILLATQHHRPISETEVGITVPQKALTKNSMQWPNVCYHKNLVIPLASAFFYACSSAVRKIGLNILPESVLGAVVGALTSLIAYPVILRLMGRTGEFKLSKKAVPWLVGGGIATSTAWIGMFTATQMGSVSVTSAIIGANPLFGLILSAILLRDSEKITKRVAAGSLLIVVAVLIITLF